MTTPFNQQGDRELAVKEGRRQPRARPRLLDERLVTALEHDTRAHALATFTQRAASTKEIAAELDLGVSAVWYHVKKLRELGCIELVDVKRRRGARECFYRATVRHFFDADAWAAVPERKRAAITMGVLRLIAADLDAALRADAVAAPDNHVSRTVMVVDREGWGEAAELLAATIEGFMAIRENAAVRRAESGEESIRASASMLLFELPREDGR